jgi:hypothetical protein
VQPACENRFRPIERSEVDAGDCEQLWKCIFSGNDVFPSTRFILDFEASTDSRDLSCCGNMSAASCQEPDSASSERYKPIRIAALHIGCTPLASRFKARAGSNLCTLQLRRTPTQYHLSLSPRCLTSLLTSLSLWHSLWRRYSTVSVSEPIFRDGSLIIFVGIYLVSFGFCVHSLFFTSQKKGTALYYYLVVTALLLFLFATLDVALILQHVLEAFCWYKGGGHAVEQLSLLSYWVNAMKVACCAGQTSVADAMLVRFISLFTACPALTCS